MNSVCEIGRLGADPEVRYTPSGTPVANLSLAVEDRWNGNVTTSWFRVVCWRKLAEIVAEYTHKGSLVGVEGRLRSRQWEDKEGVKRTVVEIIANSVKFLDPAKEKAEAEAEAEEVDDSVNIPDDDENIPF